jgi:hypothetical protein
MSVDQIANAKGTVAGSTFHRQRPDNGGWSEDITDRSYERLVEFLKERDRTAIDASGTPLYHANREQPQSCWDADSMGEHAQQQDESDTGWWFHIDEGLDDEPASTFRVKEGASLALLDLTFLGRHEQLWAEILQKVNEDPDLLGAGVADTPSGVARRDKIDVLTAAIGKNSTGKDALQTELAGMGIYSAADHTRWFWQAMRDAGADGYVSYDHDEARLVDTLSPDLLQRPFLPPIVDRFGHPEDAMVLASENTSVHAHANEMIVRSTITFPQVVLTAQGARKLDWAHHLHASERECMARRARRGTYDEQDSDPQIEEDPPDKTHGCTIS